MAIERIKISHLGRNQLIKLKRQTGIKQWNVLCRWAFCLSLAENSIPSPSTVSSDTALEIDWRIFGGKNHEIYLALLKQRCFKDDLGTEIETLKTQFRLHLHRGIGMLAANNNIIYNIASLVRQHHAL